MASNTERSPFLNYWGHYCKDAFGQAISAVGINFQFSEGLVKSLYYETDVGSIPRGINFHKTTTAQYADSKNWKYPIHGCYWCVEKVKTTDFLGIFCSRECLIYFHDWCIEKVEFFTNKRFCRLLGCDKILHNRDKPYCSGSDEGKFDAAFLQFSDYQKLFKSVVRSGPNWYDKAISIDMKYNRAKYNLEFPELFRTKLIYNTDVGVIPRGRVIHEHLTSKYSDTSNWSAEIKGCYNCDNRNVSKFYNEMFCKERCQLVFYEWCRKKIERETTIRFCQLPGCPKLASEGFECCNREHSNQIEQKYTESKIINIKRMSSMSPTWYNRSVTPFESIQPMNQQTSTTKTQISHSHLQSSSSSFIFSRQLTEFLYFQTDVGPIPREIQPFLTSPPNTVNQNWTVPITQCYWCCARPCTVHNIACSNKCFFFFNEWLHNKFTDISNKRLCRVLSCKRYPSGSFKCCNRDHSVQFESSFKQYFSLLKDTEFILGPSWYADYSRNRIEFYNLEVPFYEFTKYKSKADTPPDQTPTPSYPSSSKPANVNTIADSQDKSKSDIPPNPQSQTFSLPTSSISSDIKINVFKFSNKLSAYLSQHTDVGLIPRRSGQQSHTSDQFPLRNPCSNVDIVGCYWCGNSNARFEEIACCVRCWLLLHEWCVRRVEQVCRLKLCGLSGCEEPRVDPCECCSIEHVKERSLLIKGESIRLQEEIELTLGPKWYRDFTPIYFSESGPFSELSNSFPSLLILYRMIWPTVQHCMCAQKLLGTPYLHHVRKMERLHELEEWEIRCVKWVRPDWEGVRKRVLYQALMAKFQQNCVLKGLLLRTGSRPLVCRDNVHLGDLLMSVREMLKAATFFPSMNSSFSECENISSANSSTKVKLNEPFSVLQSNESKADTTLDQTPTPSYLGSSQPEDVNVGTGSQDTFMTDTPPVNNTSQTNQPDPANSIVQNSLNPQLNPISSQLTDVSVNQSDKSEQVIVPLADQASDTTEVVQIRVTSGDISHDSATFSPPGSTDDM